MNSVMADPALVIGNSWKLFRKKKKKMLWWTFPSLGTFSGRLAWAGMLVATGAAILIMAPLAILEEREQIKQNKKYNKVL